MSLKLINIGEASNKPLILISKIWLKNTKKEREEILLYTLS